MMDELIVMSLNTLLRKFEMKTHSVFVWRLARLSSKKCSVYLTHYSNSLFVLG